MTKVKQITAWVDSKPGELGRITEALGKAQSQHLGCHLLERRKRKPRASLG